MSLLNDFVLLPLAQAAPQAAPQGGGGDFSILPFMLVAIVVAGYMFVVMPERRKQKAFKEQLAGIKKNDRVVTIGGIYGVVANVNREADKITLKVDDNTKIDFSLTAISRVITPDAGDKDKEKDKKD